MNTKARIARRFTFLGLCWIQLFPCFSQAGSYTLAYWREPGSNENHGNHSAYVHVWDENGQPLSGKQIYTSWGVLLGATDPNGYVEIELRRPNGYDFQVRDGAHRSDITPVLSVERAPDWGHYSYEIGFLFKPGAGNPRSFDTNWWGTINDSSADPCVGQSAPCTRSLAFYSTDPTSYCSDSASLGTWTAAHGQTFVATGNRVMAVKAMLAAGYNVHYYWTAQILEGGPNGPPVGPARSTRLMVDGEYFPILVKWGINEVQVVPGRTYYLKTWAEGGVNVWRVNQNNYSGGNYYQNGVSVPGAEMMGLVVCAAYTNSGPLGQLTGWVLDNSGRPLAGAVVSLSDVALYTLSSSDGSYTLPLIPAGTHDVSAAKPGYTAGLNFHVPISASLTTTSSFSLWPQSGSAGSGIITNGASFLQPFEAVPKWTSTFDASWGNAASFVIEASGQSGNALQASRTGSGSSARVQVFPLKPNTPYSLSVWIRCPSFSSSYWAECGYKLGSFSAQDFDANSASWSLVRKFGDTGENGNGNIWKQYTVNFNSAGSSSISIGFKLGAASGTGPMVRWDQLTLASLVLPGVGLAVANSASNLTVQFLEPVSEAAATNTENYSLSHSGAPASVREAVLLGTTNVVLATEARLTRTDYTLTVSNVVNPLQPASLVGPNGQLAVRVPVPLILPDDGTRWSYEQSGSDPGPGWRTADFEDGSWPKGPALLAWSTNSTPEPIRTVLVNAVNVPSACFRMDFVLPPLAMNALLRLRSVVADGAVFWLNGSELFRIGMGNAPVSFTTPASRTVAVPVYEGPFDLAAPSLVPGTNLLAVEVHKAAADGPQLVFGTILEALIFPSQIPFPVLSCAPRKDGFTLSWEAPGFTLETATDLMGPWTPVPNIRSPAAFPLTNPAAFFRLRQ